MERITTSTRSINYGLALLDVNKKCKKAKSGTYAACEQMIQMSFMVMQVATLDQVLDKFESSGRLTPREHQSLLRLAKQLWDQNS